MRPAILNDGYRVLRDPIKRAEYLLAQEGFDIGEQRSKNVPPELLEEVFELNMLLEEAPDRGRVGTGSRKVSRHAARDGCGTGSLVRKVRFVRRSRHSASCSRCC